MKEINVTADWDTEVQVWIASSEDVPGLVAEAESLPTLVTKLQEIVPELYSLNRHLVKTSPDRISITVDYQRFGKYE